MSGSLLGDIPAQVGGSVLGLFTPSKVDLNKVPEGAYVAVGGLVPLCIKPDTSKATAALDELSPSSMMNMLTGSDVARGKFVGDENLNGKPVKHYVIDGDAFLAAAQKSSDPKLQAFAEALWSADDIDLYVDAAGGYPVALRGNFSGAFEPLKFEGDLGMQIELTGINDEPKGGPTGLDVKSPSRNKACRDAVAGAVCARPLLRLMGGCEGEAAGSSGVVTGEIG